MINTRPIFMERFSQLPILAVQKLRSTAMTMQNQYETLDSETNMNVEHDATMDILIKMIELNPGVDLWGARLCGRSSQWQSLNLRQYGASFAGRFAGPQAKPREHLEPFFFCRLAKIVNCNGGRVTSDWPRHCAGWALQELRGLIQDCGDDAHRLRKMPGGAP